jgi:hypothetical protein
VDVEAVARALQLRIGRVSTTGFVGAMFPGEEGVGGLININGGFREDRQRFTIAHEIGHYMLLDNKVAPSVCSFEDVGTWRSDSRKERAADIFAAELLLPDQEVRSLISAQAITFRTAELIKNTYNVSFTAAAYRCVELSNDECALVVTVKGVVKHYKPSTSWGYEIRTNRAPRRGTEARRLLDHPGEVESCAIVSAREWARERAYTDLDVQLWEESISQIGYNTILSFLTVLH